MSRMPCSQCGAMNEARAKFCSECGEPRRGPAVIGEQPVKNSTGAIVFAILLVLAPLGFFLFSLTSGGAKGEIRSRGKPFGTYVQKPPACHSGQHENFFGVWVAPEVTKRQGRSGFQGGIKLLKTELGEWAAFVESPVECEGFKCKIQKVDAKHCKVFDIDVRNTSTSINDIRLREGHAKLDCSFPEGGSLVVNLTFDGCS
ncbi:MAG TPA: zinc ribbon domain-containing protein [Polyangiaceae bacterium]